MRRFSVWQLRLLSSQLNPPYNLIRNTVSRKFLRVRFRLLRPKHPLDAVPVRLGRRERAVLFEQLARAALHTREHVLRYLGEIPTALCQRGRAEGSLQLPLVLLEES